MAEFDQELLAASQLLVTRRKGQRGKLASARVRRSISTTYYALFHFLLEEVGMRAVGAANDLRVRRRMLVRTVTHRGARAALTRIVGPKIEGAFQEYFGTDTAPLFAVNLARAFADAQSKRLDADYDLNKYLSEEDARVLRLRVRRVVQAWRGAKQDKDFKHALCLLILLNGKLRTEEA